MLSAADYIVSRQAGGQFVFTTGEAVTALGTSVPAARAALRRLKHKGHIADPYRGFHVIVTPAYRRLGCLPAEQFISQLMAHLGEPYYVGLLSAARYHGAGHQAPMELQVIVAKPRRAITCGGVRITFVARHDMQPTLTVERNTETGVIRIATPEATALELVGYPERCGYLDNVATVLTELAEVMQGEALAAEARRAPIAWVQRLGHLLVLVDAGALAAYLEPIVVARDACMVRLASWKTMTGAARDKRWRVAVNVEVEADV